MVSGNATSRSEKAVIDAKPIHRAVNPEATTADAAKKARQIATWVTAQVNSNDVPEADGPDEHALFVALQVSVYRATRNTRDKAGAPAERHAWGERRKIIRNHLVNRHLGLAYAMFARFQSSQVDRDDLRSEAMLALVRAVEGFNPWRGFRFSTYACRAIIRAMIEAVRKSNRYELRFVAEPEAESAPPSQTSDWSEVYLNRLRRTLHDNRGDLTEREATILAGRFGVGGGAKRTLSQVGALMGLTKERVRQIQNKALAKLRGALES